MHNVIESMQERMEKSLEQLHNELAKIRTGRASASILDGVKVSCYGTLTPITQVASINVEDARTLVISPWDKNLMNDIDKAIRISDLGLNPNSQADLIRINLPPLSEERRKEFVKMAKAQGESSKVAVRNFRRDALAELKSLTKDKELTEDEERRLQTTVQECTDQCISKIDAMVSTKETDLITI